MMETGKEGISIEDPFYLDNNYKFRQDLSKLKTEAMGFFYKMMTLDINLEDERKEAASLVDKLKKGVDKLYEEYLDEERLLEEKIESNLNSLELTVHKVKDCSTEGIIGGWWTMSAIRDHNSFLIGTDDIGKGLKLIENGTQVYSAKLPKGIKTLYDMI